MKPIIITWSFDSHTTKPSLKCYFEIENLDNCVSAKIIGQKSSAQGTKMALLKVPPEWGRKEIEKYISYNTVEVKSTLRKSIITPHDTLRKRYSETKAITDA